MRTPTTSPFSPNAGPPEFPGLIAASIWITRCPVHTLVETQVEIFVSRFSGCKATAQEGHAGHRAVPLGRKGRVDERVGMRALQRFSTPTDTGSAI